MPRGCGWGTEGWGGDQGQVGWARPFVVDASGETTVVCCSGEVSEAQGRGFHAGQDAGTESPPRGKPQLQEP